MVRVFPAVGVSLVLIFIAGIYFTGVILEQLSKDIKKYPKFYGSTVLKLESYLTERVKKLISFLGGGISVGLLFLLIKNAHPERQSLIWFVLTAIGILFGIYTFLNNNEK